jgi:hypothetical protein
MALTYNLQAEPNEPQTVPWIVVPMQITAGLLVLIEYFDKSN